MRVGLNATPFNDRPSGARQRFVGIYGALVRQRPDWTFIVYEPADCRVAKLLGSQPNVVVRSTPIASTGRLQRIVNGARFWRGAFADDDLDIFEDFVLPMVKHPKVPTVLTIHDIRHVHEASGLIGPILRKGVSRRAFKQADRIIVVSDAVGNEIRAFHPAARLSTVYNGVDAADFSPEAQGLAAEIRTRYALPDRYVLAVGHLEARKNLSLLIDAVALLRDRGTPRPLVIVGNDGGERGNVLARIAQRDLGTLVTLVEGADDAAVRAIYAGCALLAFPSRYEGFGIPILEAMAADKPMALADTPVFRELTQGRSLYFPVDDAQAAAATIERAWSDRPERDRQVMFGRERVRDFAFGELARQVATIYEDLL